jgi:hypothetical protein
MAASFHKEDSLMEVSVVPTIVTEKAAIEIAVRSAELRRRNAGEGGVAAACKLMYSPFWSAIFRCEVKRVLLPPRRGAIGAGADAFSGFVSLIAGAVRTTVGDVQENLLLPPRFQWPEVQEKARRHVTDYFVHKLRRVPTCTEEKVELIYRPIWVAVLDLDGQRVIRCVDAHSGDPLYYLDKSAEEIAGLAGLFCPGN